MRTQTDTMLFCSTRLLSIERCVWSWLVLQLFDDVVASPKHFPVNKILDTDTGEDSHAYEGDGSDASLRDAECVVDYRKYEAHETYRQNPRDCIDNHVVPFEFP